MYDVADSILAQKLSQVEGVGQVIVGGGAKPAVRVEVNPTLLNKLGIGLEQVRTALGSSQCEPAKGAIRRPDQRLADRRNDQLFTADEYRHLIVAYNNGAPVRLSTSPTCRIRWKTSRNMGLANGKPAVLIIVFRQPGANIIETVDRVAALLPLLQASIPPAIKLTWSWTAPPRFARRCDDIEITLLISIVLVILVVLLFCATFAPRSFPASRCRFR